MLIASGLSWVGMIHGYELEANSVVSVVGPPSPDRWGADFCPVRKEAGVGATARCGAPPL